MVKYGIIMKNTKKLFYLVKETFGIFFSYDNKSKKLQISVNEKIKELQLDKEFKLFDYTRHQ